MDTVTKEILSVLKNQNGFTDSLELFTGATASNASQVAADTRLIAQYTSAAASNASQVAANTNLIAQYAAAAASNASEVAKSVLGLRQTQPGAGTVSSFVGTAQLTNTLVASPGASSFLLVHKIQCSLFPSNAGGESIWFRDGASSNRYFNTAFTNVPLNTDIDLKAPWRLPINTGLTMVAGAGASVTAVVTVVTTTE